MWRHSGNHRTGEGLCLHCRALVFDIKSRIPGGGCVWGFLWTNRLLGAHLHVGCGVGEKGRGTWTAPQLKEVVSTSLVPPSQFLVAWLEKEKMLSCPSARILGRTLYMSRCALAPRSLSHHSGPGPWCLMAWGSGHRSSGF